MDDRQPNDLATALAAVPLFADLPADDLETLAAALKRKRFAIGQTVFKEGDEGNSFYVIQSGLVKVQRGAATGKEVILAMLGPGDFFGELALLDGESRSADAVAKEESVTLILDRADFIAFIESRPIAAVRLLAALSHRLRLTDQLVQDAAFLDVPARLARAILALTDAAGGKQLPAMTQSELAAMVGATRESINRCLRTYQREGLVDYAAGVMRVLNPEELRRRAS